MKSDFRFLRDALRHRQDVRDARSTCTPDVIKAAANSEDVALRLAAVGNPATPFEELEGVYAGSYDSAADAALLRLNRRATRDPRARLAFGHFIDKVLIGEPREATSPRTNPNRLRTLARSSRPAIAFAVAANPSTPADVILRLAKLTEEEAYGFGGDRLAYASSIVQNPSAPVEALEIVARQSNSVTGIPQKAKAIIHKKAAQGDPHALASLISQ